MNAKLLDILRGKRKQIAQLTLKRSEYAIWIVRLWAFRQASWSASPLPVSGPVTYANPHPPTPPPPDDIRIYSNREQITCMHWTTDRSAVNTENILPLHRAILFILYLKNWFLPLKKRGNSSTKINRYRIFGRGRKLSFLSEPDLTSNKPWWIRVQIQLNITSPHSCSYQFRKRFPCQKDECLSCFPIFAASSCYLRTPYFKVSAQAEMLLSMWHPQIIT
jgi:hypothetical protein